MGIFGSPIGHDEEGLVVKGSKAGLLHGTKDPSALGKLREELIDICPLCSSSPVNR